MMLVNFHFRLCVGFWFDCVSVCDCVCSVDEFLKYQKVCRIRILFWLHAVSMIKDFV